jgi:serine/threonine-protein kinase
MELRNHLRASLGAGYAVERELEGGGTFRLFLATELGPGRRVLVKVLPPELAGTVSPERFREAIQPATRLQHPYIVPLLSSGGAEGHLYYTVPFVPGESLRGRLPEPGNCRSRRRSRCSARCPPRWPTPTSMG